MGIKCTSHGNILADTQRFDEKEDKRIGWLRSEDRRRCLYVGISLCVIHSLKDCVQGRNQSCAVLSAGPSGNMTIFYIL